jgi:hypothetical protein
MLHSWDILPLLHPNRRPPSSFSRSAFVLSHSASLPSRRRRWWHLLRPLSLRPTVIWGAELRLSLCVPPRFGGRSYLYPEQDRGGGAGAAEQAGAVELEVKVAGSPQSSRLRSKQQPPPSVLRRPEPDGRSRGPSRVRG